jgi:hypothetical protein
MSVASLVVCAALATSAAEGALSPAPPVSVLPPLPLMTTDFVRVTAPWIAIPIESPPTVCEVGKHLMLIQENDEFFIAMCSNAYQGVFLAAFPVSTREGRPAWTTPEQKVFFAYRTASCRGRLYFKRGDELPVDDETRREFKLRLERFDHAFPLFIAKTNAGIEFAKAPPPPSPAQIAMLKAAQKPAPTPAQKTTSASSQKSSPAPPPRLPPVHRYIVTPVGPSTNVFTISVLEKSPAADAGGQAGEKKDEGFFNRLFSRSGADAEKQPEAVKTGSAPGPDTSAAKTQSVQKSTTAAGTIATNAAIAKAPLTTNAPATSEGKGAKAPTSGLMASVARYQTPAIIMAAIVLFIVGLFWESRRKVRNREIAMAEAAKALGVAADGSGTPPPIPGTANDFSGSIASMSLGSVTQFLNSDKETGILHVKDKSNAELGTLVFIKGEIVDAKSPKKRGIDALYEILRNKEGFFSFLREEPKEVEKTITTGTISLLLDAHRIMDEEFKPAAPTPPPVPKTPAPAKTSRPATPKAVTKLKLHGNH